MTVDTNTPLSAYWRSQDSVDSLLPRLVSCLELPRTDAGKIAMAARAIVERIDVVGHIGHRQRSTLIDRLLDAFLLQASKERLGDGIDAPMSRCRRYVCQIRNEKRTDFTDYIAFEAPADLCECTALLCTFSDVRLGAVVASHPRQGNGPQGVVGLSVSATIQSVADDSS